MDLRHLRHLIALAETGSFSRAAEQMHLTQSALSRSIQALEHSLEAQLVDRIGKRNELTPLGQAVVKQGRKLLVGADELQVQLRRLQSIGQGSLRVGLGSGPGALLMTPLLQHMATYHPKVRVSIGRGATQSQVQQLRERKLDALVIDIRSLVPAEDLTIEHLADLQAGFICRAAHPLAQQRRVLFTELLAFPVATTPLSDEVVRHLVDRYGPQGNPEQMAGLRCEEVSSLIDTARSTDAIFLGIRAAARAAIACGEMVELPVQPALDASARFGLVTLAGRTEGPAMPLLRQFVKEHLHD
jgi:DNA-binding transcriptional LysR family regulator